tara:strand:- start:757 stop:879 length:123 start_codon:yes stop_codon:yes gene_type:complete
MSRIKFIGKFVKSSFMSATDEQATVATLFAVFVLIALSVA